MMTAIVSDEKAAEAEEKEAEKEGSAPETLSLPPEDVEQKLTQDRTSKKASRRPKDPCLFEYTAEDFEREPITEYQDSLEAAGYPYW
jgi:hypothetical protein